MPARKSLLMMLSVACGILGSSDAVLVRAQSAQPPVINLMTDEGAAQVKGQWRYSDVRIVEVSSRPTDENLTKIVKAEPNGRLPVFFPQRLPVGERTTYDIVPRAQAVDFDDSSWEAITPRSISDFRSGGQFCFGWYRISLTMPERVGNFATTGSKAFLTINLDDYSEIWVQGRLPYEFGKPSPNVISGLNLPTRVPLSESVKPGEKIQVAIFGINGPISSVPLNRIFIREAKIDFVR